MEKDNIALMKYASEDDSKINVINMIPLKIFRVRIIMTSVYIKYYKNFAMTIYFKNFVHKFCY